MAASRKRLTVKQLIAQLNNDEDDNIDDSGDDIDENDDSESDEDVIAGALSQDDGDDDRALQDVADSDESESDDESWTCPDFTWRPANGELPWLHPYTGMLGLNVNSSNFSPENYFQLFVTDDLMNHFAIQTNLFADQYIQSHPNLGPYSTVHKWVPTNAGEMKKFFGLLLLMGVVKKPTEPFHVKVNPPPQKSN